MASALGGLAPSFGVLVAARALQGAFAALLAPAALGLLTTTFTIPAERNRAFGVFGAIAGSGAAVGLILGGALTEYLDWRWAMFVNLLLAIPAVDRRAAPAVGRRRRAGEPAADRHPRHADRLGRPVRARLRLLQRRDPRLGRAADDRRARRRRRAAGRVRRRSSAASSTRCCRCASSPTAPAAASFLAVAVVGAGMFGVFLFLTYYMQQTLGFSPLVDRPGVPADDGRDHADRRDRPDAPAPALRPAPLVTLGMLLGAVAMLMFTGVTVRLELRHATSCPACS